LPGNNPNIDVVACGACHELHRQGGANITQSQHPITGTIDFNKAFLRANVDKYVPNAVTPANLHGGNTLAENTDIPKEGEIVPANTPNRAIEGGDETTARGYCQVCHTYTKYHRRTGTATGQLLPDGSLSADHTAWDGSKLLPEGDPRCHDGTSTYATTGCGEGIGVTPTLDGLNNGDQTDCGECHQHNNSFIGSGGDTDCTVCHGLNGGGTTGPNARPNIIAQLELARSHIPGGGTATEPDCLVCHDQSGHPDTIVGVRELDPPSIVRNQPTPAASTIAPAEAETFAPLCMSCHDDAIATDLPDHAGDNTVQTKTSPFTDTTPATFAARTIGSKTDWTNASHNRPASGSPVSDTTGLPNPVTCLGDGSTGCHASAHGTDTQSLLANVASLPATPDFTAFCINCHDGDGPSSIDIEAQFPTSTATDWAAGPSNYTTPNKQHDVLTTDQAVSGASLACSNCHDPHANSAVEPVAIPDTGASLRNYSPTNTATYFDPDVGSDLPFTYSIAGDEDSSDPGGSAYVEKDYIEFCIACHDGQAPPGVTMPGTVLNIGYFFGSDDRNVDQHGIGEGFGSGKGTLKAPYDGSDSLSYSAINCSTCHEAHGSTNIYNLRTQVSVGGQQMQVGSIFWTATEIEATTPGQTFGDTSYTLPVNADGQQEDLGWGAWCSFCHDVNHGSGDGLGCSSGHLHGGGNF